MSAPNSPSKSAKSVPSTSQKCKVTPGTSPWNKSPDLQCLFAPSLQGQHLSKIPHGATRRGAIDLNAIGSVKSDWWHHQCVHRVATTTLCGSTDQSSTSVSLYSLLAASSASSLRSRSSSLSSTSTLCSSSSSVTYTSSMSRSEDMGISFIPDEDTKIAGVAMSELVYGEGVLFGDDLVTKHIGIDSGLLEDARLLINWPGYTHLNMTYPLSFTDQKGMPLSISQLGKQIANIFRRFLNDHWKYFDPSQRNGVRLGPCHVNFSHLRLRSVCFRNATNSDGYEDGFWVTEVSYAVT